MLNKDMKKRYIQQIQSQFKPTIPDPVLPPIVNPPQPSVPARTLANIRSVINRYIEKR